MGPRRGRGRGLARTQDAWVIVDGNVYDVTKFAKVHPGPRPGPRLFKLFSLVFTRFSIKSLQKPYKNHSKINKKPIWGGGRGPKEMGTRAPPKKNRYSKAGSSFFRPILCIFRFFRDCFKKSIFCYFLHKKSYLWIFIYKK